MAVGLDLFEVLLALLVGPRTGGPWYVMLVLHVSAAANAQGLACAGELLTTGVVMVVLVRWWWDYHTHTCHLGADTISVKCPEENRGYSAPDPTRGFSGGAPNTFIPQADQADE